MRRLLGFLITSAALMLSVLLAGCAGVRTEDLQAWEGAPVSALEKHPLFLTMSMVRTVASDGTEIRNYVNGRQISECSGGGTVFHNTVSMAQFNSFTECTKSFPACNNIFYINRGRVTRYTPVGSGGARCFTDDRTRPDFSGPTNL